MALSREQICQSTARKLSAGIAGLAGLKTVVGLDGFVDEIIAVVDKRYAPDHYDPIPTIEALGEKIRRAAGESSNFELVVKQRKLGGNGPIMAHALAVLGLDVTYIGSLGLPRPDPVFDDFARRAAVHSIAQPGHTDALEFEDGKLMLGKYEHLNDVDWEHLVAGVGRERLAALLHSARLVGLVNWTMLPQMSQIWRKLHEEGLMHGERAGRTLFIDLADPEKRTPEDIHEGLELLSAFQDQVDVVLGLNLKESSEVAAVLHLPAPADPEAAVEATAAAVRQALGVACVVIHPRRGAAAASAAGGARFAGPFVGHPVISTGAGDHFNAGFCLGRALGMDLAECLCAGVATSGYYVRSAHGPTAAQLAEFVASLPPPQEERPFEDGTNL